MKLGTRVAWVAPLLFFTTLALAAPGPKKSAASVARGAAATEVRAATDAALAELKAGGSAADAAVVAALVAGVASPSSSGLGGGGFALVFDAEQGKVTAFDFRETAPSGIDAGSLDARPVPLEARGKLVGVPGEALGLYELHRRFGKRPWQKLVAPAERLAKDGFPVSVYLASSLGPGADLRNDAALAALYYPQGNGASAGRRLKNPKLARTLARLKLEGPSAIYSGSIASELVRVVRERQGTLTLDDLAAYRVREREPLHVRWAGLDVFTMPPPSAGGLLVAQLLGLFGRDELRRHGLRSGLTLHLLAEGMRGAFADRARFIGDPDHVPVDWRRLLEPARLAKRKAGMSNESTRGVREYVLAQHGTHHLVVADRAGNVVSLNTTINSAFGADFVAPESGIVLNDQLLDFTTPAEMQRLGLRISPNRPRPRARPVSSMAPTIVLEGQSPRLALGGSGGTSIPQNVAQVLLSVLAFDESATDALTAPRFHLSTGEATLALDSGFPDSVRDDLTRRGESLAPNRFTTTAVQLIQIGPLGATAAADARKGGTAGTR